MAFPSTFLDLQNAVIAKMGLEASDRSRVKDWINQVYAQVCVETEALQDAATAPDTGGVSGYILPVQILRIKAFAAAPPSGGYGGALKQVSLDEILSLRSENEWAGANNGSATSYALVGMSRLEFWPTPTAADTILIYYVHLPVALAQDTDVPVLQEPYSSKLLEYGALAEAADFVAHPEHDRYRALYEDWLRRFRTHLNRRRGAGTGQLRVVGEPVGSVGRDVDRGW